MAKRMLTVLLLCFFLARGQPVTIEAPPTPGSTESTTVLPTITLPNLLTREPRSKLSLKKITIHLQPPRGISEGSWEIEFRENSTENWTTKTNNLPLHHTSYSFEHESFGGLHHVRVRVHPKNHYHPSNWTSKEVQLTPNLDWCAEDNGGCEQRCVNNEYRSGYHCECSAGSFHLADDLHNCTDVDECQEKIDECGHVCVNTKGSFFCRCNSGYILKANGHDCEDINECSFGPGMACEDTCTNTNGSYECKCDDPLHKLDKDNHSCTHCPSCQDFEALKQRASQLKEKVTKLLPQSTTVPTTQAAPQGGGNNLPRAVGAA